MKKSNSWPTSYVYKGPRQTAVPKEKRAAVSASPVVQAGWLWYLEKQRTLSLYQPHCLCRHGDRGTVPNTELLYPGTESQPILQQETCMSEVTGVPRSTKTFLLPPSALKET